MDQTSDTQRRLARNGPCFCGSGKKYKRCCGASEKHAKAAASAVVPKRAAPSHRYFTLFALILLVAISIFAMISVYRKNIAANAEAEQVPATPEPWQYDPISDRHWHPIHQHWHEGRPPQDSSVTPAVSQ